MADKHGIYPEIGWNWLNHNVTLKNQRNYQCLNPRSLLPHVAARSPWPRLISSPANAANFSPVCGSN